VQRPQTCGPKLPGWPANTWQVTDLIKLVIAPWTPINTPLPMEFDIPHSTCCPPLVNIPLESRVKSSLRSSSESSLKDR
jgi:hypothetical protein